MYKNSLIRSCVCAFLTIIVISIISIPVLAELAQKVDILTESFTRGADAPTSAWNASTEGQYKYSGSSNNSTLYTNYYFSGKSSYSIYVNNTGNNDIRVQFIRYSDGEVLDTQWVSSRDSDTFTLDTNSSFYIEFIAPLFIGYGDFIVQGTVS